MYYDFYLNCTNLIKILHLIVDTFFGKLILKISHFYDFCDSNFLSLFIFRIQKIFVLPVKNDCYHNCSMSILINKLKKTFFYDFFILLVINLFNKNRFKEMEK